MAKKPLLTLAVENELIKEMRTMGGSEGRELLRETLLNDVRFSWKTDEDIARNVRVMVLIYPDVVGCKVIDWEKADKTHKKIYVELTMLDGSKVRSSFKNNGDFKRYLRGYGSRGQSCDLRNGDKLKWETIEDVEANFAPIIAKYRNKEGRKIAWYKFDNLRPYSSECKAFTMYYKLDGSNEVFVVEQLTNMDFHYYASGERDILKEGTSRNEKYMEEVLKELSIPYKTHQPYKWLLGVGGRELRDDARFEHEDRLVIIEMQGEHHYEPVPYKRTSEGIAEANERFKVRQKHDQMKRDYCKANGITLIEVKCLASMTEQEIKQDLLNELKKHNIM